MSLKPRVEAIGFEGFIFITLMASTLLLIYLQRKPIKHQTLAKHLDYVDTKTSFERSLRSKLAIKRGGYEK